MDSLDFFRRNLKPIMAALTLMAMITFVFDDSMRAGNTTLVPIILAILFGGGAFVWGTRKGKQNEYLGMGALVGAVLGLVIMFFGDPDQGEQPAIAGLSARDVANLKNRRETANRIVAAIYRKSHPIPEQFLKAGQFGQQFYQMQMQRALEQIQFTFGNDDFEKDVIFGDLLRREAARLGISVNDDAVSDFIKMISDQKLSTQDFREVKQELHVGDHYIYDVLREEIAARMAAEMTFPRAVATPQQRWEAFRKVNVKNAIEATTIPVEAFVKGVPDPPDSELLAFFKEHADKFPSPKGEPGFRQPARARLAYLEADYETIEAKVTPPTDEEIAKYYEDNKEFFIDRTPVKTESKDDAIEGDDAKRPEGEDAKKEDSQKPDEKKDGEKEKADKPEEPKADKPKSDKPDDSEKPKSDKPADEPKKETEKKETEPKDSEKKSDSEEDGSECGDEAEEAKPDEPKKEEPKADGEKKEAPKADDAKAEKKEDDKKSDDKKSEDKPKTEPTDSKDDKPAKEGEKSEKPEDKDDEKAEKKPELKYKPFEDVKDKIHDDLLRTRTLEEMKKRIEAAVVKMRRLGSYTSVPRASKRGSPDAYFAELKEIQKAPKYKSPEDVASELKEIASSADLKYVQTPLLSAEELSKSEEFKIGSATDATDDAMNRQGAASVIQRVFGRGNDSMFSPEIAEDPGTKNRFAYWVVERDEAHVPKFDEEGIREQVVKAWKLAKAAPKAEERAKAIAKLADGKKLTEAVAGETVTGDKEGQALTVLAPEEKVSHFTLSGMSAPNLNAFQGGNERLELSQIAGLEKLGDDFFSGIDKLKPGETAALPNFDRSAFIVVHVVERGDIAAEEDAPQRGDFMKTWPFSPPANQLASFDFDPLRREWMQSIERKYNVKWPVK